MKYEDLSREQQQFITYASEGYNILVDACIGSGKTTAIQTLCDCLPGKRILYLTYNKLLKLDAKSRIKSGYVNVTNYHGFCYSELLRINVRPGITELIQVYNKKKPKCANYDILILDEYQDIEQEIAEMLENIKACCKDIQIIAVGDMEQKIYDKTRLDVQKFITGFLGDHFIPMEFTNCFRIAKEHAAMLGRVWNKSIVGVNDSFEIREVYEHEAAKIASELEPRQLLVLGSKAGKAQNFQNYLESRHKDKYNKKTLWSKIKDSDGATSPTPDCAVFTTYDGCKGMEREVCILFDWSWEYWQMRLNKPDTRYEILRNIFCVAASRAKKLLLIVKADSPLTEKDLRTDSAQHMPYRDMAVSDMFDFKFIEDVEAAYKCLEITEIQPVGESIDVPVKDELIDLSLCIGHFQEAMYFDNYNIDEELEYCLSQPERSYMRRQYEGYTIDQKLLYLSTLETKQMRYMNQVKALPISTENRQRIKERLSEHLPQDAIVQKKCTLPVYSGKEHLFDMNGICDAIHENIVYELKFVTALSHTHALQTAMYLVCMGYETGRLWNVRTNQMVEIKIPDRLTFLDNVVNTVTKGRLARYLAPGSVLCGSFYHEHREICEKCLEIARKKETYTSKQVRAFFLKRGLALPVSGTFFVNHMLKGRKG